MAEPILDPKYWKRRLRDAPPEALHHAIFRCPTDLWLRIEEKHRKILHGLIGEADNIYDGGCGWGRLLTLLPSDWKGWYLGVDISPDFVEIANKTYPSSSYPTCCFAVGDLRKAGKKEYSGVKFDWAILVSIRPMFIRNVGQEGWDEVEEGLLKIAKRILFLEYDENDPGTILEG